MHALIYFFPLPLWPSLAILMTSLDLLDFPPLSLKQVTSTALCCLSFLLPPDSEHHLLVSPTWTGGKLYVHCGFCEPSWLG